MNDKFLSKKFCAFLKPFSLPGFNLLCSQPEERNTRPEKTRRQNMTTEEKFEDKLY